METHTLSPFQQKLFDVFKDTISFLEKHKLRYFVCGGTLLGIIRHKGFIPWDDDIDIYMYREDYNRLFELKEELQKEGYRFQSIDDENYYLSFGKIIDTHSTIWEKERFECLTGVYIDIFPIDRFSYDDRQMLKNQIKGRRLFRRYQTTIRKTPAKQMFKYLYQFRFPTFYIALRTKLLKNTRAKYLSSFLKFEKAFTDNRGDKCVSLTTAKGCIFACEWFDNMEQGVFEGMSIKIPKGWHQYLTCLYGDYMTLPPEEKRVSGHPSVYVNLEERLSLQEVKQRLGIKE